MMGKRKIVFPTAEEKRIDDLERENQTLKAQNQALSDRTDFQDGVISEIILAMYQ